MSEPLPFLSFYGRHKISPVHQDVSDIDRHFQRRQYLYRNLGLPPFAITGKSVMEFGPGSGHNALYTAHLGPRRHVLVEGNPTGMTQCKRLLRKYPECEFVKSKIQDFTTGERFDVVLCEGVIPHQKEPSEFTRHVGSFVRPGGVLVITVADYVSVFPEVLRRVICDTIVANDAPLSEKIDKLVPVFRSHYATLTGASRPIEDWLIDTLLCPWDHGLYSFEDAVSALYADFEVYGTSPKFLTDSRWYKDLNGFTACLNERAISQYRASLPSPAVVELCRLAFWNANRIRNSAEPDFADMIDICSCIVAENYFALPVAEVVSYLRSYKTADAAGHFDTFKSWFGHGQQYVSFVKS